MGLSNDLISQFVKTTKDTSKTKKEEIVYGTVKTYNGEKYVQLDGSDLLTPITSTMIIDENDRVTVVIKNHTATVTGNITHPGASGQLVESMTGQMDNIIIDNAIIKEKLEATEGRFVILEADYVTINEKLIAAEAAIRVLDTEKLSADQADIKYATIGDLNATNAKIYNLEATYGDFTVLTTEKFEAVEAIIAVLDAEKASIDDLDAIRAQIQILDAGKADIDDLTAGNIKFDTASGGTLDVQTLLARFITGENAQFLNLTSANTTIANAMIKDAMIASLSVSKLTSGTINTNNINIASDDNSMVISDGTIIFYDKDGNVRLQIGENAEGDFDIILIGADGSSTLLDSTGIKEDAIADKLIKTEMINDKAVGADQINYESFISGLNADGTGELIKSSKVELDGTGQTLSVVFNQMETKVEGLQDQLDNLEIPEGVDGLKETVTTHTTAINVMQGQISTLVSENTIIKGDITEIENHYSTMDQTVDSIKTTVNSHESTIGELEQQVTVNTSTIEQLQDEINLKVSNSEIQQAIKDIKVGGRNYIQFSDFVNNTSEWVQTKDANNTGTSTVGNGVMTITSAGSSYIQRQIYSNRTATALNDLTIGETYTLSIEVKVEVHPSRSGTLIDLRCSKLDNTTSSKIVIADDLRNVELNKWIKLEKTGIVTWDPADFNYWRVIIQGVLGGTIHFRKPKLELGTKSTDWTCAPEDVEADYIGKIETVQNQVTNNTSEIQILKNQITLKVSSSDFNSLKTTVQTNSSTIETLENSVEANTSSIDVLKGQIDLKVDSSDIQEAIKDIKVGGRNLILNSTWNLGINTNWTSNNNFSLLDPESDKPNSKILYISKSGLTSDAYAQKWSKEIYMTDVGNTEYTYSFDFKTTDWGNLKSIGGIRTFDTLGLTAAADSVYNFTITTDNVTVEKVVNEWVRVSVTVKPTGGKYIRFGVYQTRNGTSYFRELKGELGNVATDWMCAPEDIEADYNNKIENVQTQVTNNTSEIQILKNQITLKVSSSDFNSLKTTVQTNSSTIQTLETSVETNTSSIEVLKGQIDLKVESTDIQEAIETIRFGGRNYIQFSDFINNTSEWVQSKGADNTGTSTIGDGVMTITSGGSSYIQRQIYSNRKATALNDLMIGETYTLSVEVKVEVHPSKTGTLMDLRYNKSDNTTSSQIVIADDLRNVELNKWIKLEKTGTITWDPANFNYWRVIIQGVLDGKIHFRKPKLELGTKSTDWTAAPEDTNTAIKDIETKVTTTQNSIANLLIDMNSITSRVSSTETTVSTLNGNVTNLTSRVNTAEQKLTAEALTTTISSAIENGTGDISTTEFVMDKDGLTIKNGAIIVKNNAGDVVLEGDTNGNLMLKGTITVDTTNNEQIIVLSENSDLPIMKAMDHGLYAKSLTVADSVADWENNRAWMGVEILPSGIVANNGTIISAWDMEAKDVEITGNLKYNNITGTPTSTSTWTLIGTLEVTQSGGEAYAAIGITNTGDTRNEAQRGLLYARLSVQGDMGVEDNVNFDFNLEGGGKENYGLATTHIRAQISVCSTTRVMVSLYMCAAVSKRRWQYTLQDWYGHVTMYSNQSYASLGSGLTTFTPTNIFVSQEVRANYFRPKTATNLYILTSKEGSNHTGVYISSSCNVKFLYNGTTIHEFKNDGTKTGGSMEIDGVRYGMSPTDSPQTLIEYIVPDVIADGITKVPLDDIYKKMVSYYIVMSSNPDVRVKEKTSDYILLSGTGTTDLLIKGQRKGADEHFRIMNNLKYD